MSIKEEVAKITTQSKLVDGISAVDMVVPVVLLQSLIRQAEPIPKDVAGMDVESSRLQECVISVNSTTIWANVEVTKVELFSTLILISARTQNLSVNQILLHHLSGLLVSSIG